MFIVIVLLGSPKLKVTWDGSQRRKACLARCPKYPTSRSQPRNAFKLNRHHFQLSTFFFVKIPALDKDITVRSLKVVVTALYLAANRSSVAFSMTIHHQQDDASGAGSRMDFDLGKFMAVFAPKNHLWLLSQSAGFHRVLPSLRPKAPLQPALQKYRKIRLCPMLLERNLACNYGVVTNTFDEFCLVVA